MKKHLAILTTALAAVLGLLLLSACANPFIAPRERNNSLADKGLVRIGTGAGPARTALPAAVFDHYEYSFSHEGGAGQIMEPTLAGGNEFELIPGNWAVSVNAYAGPENDTLAATGSENFIVSLGAETEVTVKLSPIVSGGTGTLNYVLKRPDGAAVISFTLTLLAGTEDINLMSGAVSDSGSLTGTTTVNAGYYLARAVVRKDGVTAGKNEVVHIYNNLATDLELELLDDNFKAIVVVNSADSGRGTLREALTGIMAADMESAVIRIDLPANDRVITLRSALPTITKSLVIEGNSATLSQSGFTAGAASQLLYVNAATATVRISRLHFKGGRATNNGAAIRNTGILTLESCIFSDNKTSASNANGGAIYTTGGLTVSGCTFYGNAAGTTGGSGGAIYSSTGTLSLAGNVFWENTAGSNNVVYGSVISGGFNVSDKASGTDAASGSGWEFDAADKQAASLSLPVSYISFRPIGNELLNVIDARPDSYPTVDFYGVDIPETNAAAGAAQTAATGTGYFLDYASMGPGTVSVTGGTVDFDGFASATVELTASNNANGSFGYWTVGGTKQSETSNVLTLNVEKDTTLRAVFYTVVSSIGDSGPGTLREVLAAVNNGEEILLPAGQTITLNTPLPQITKSIVIEGNGATLTQNSFTAGAASQLLYVNAATATVRISRLHFKGGRATNNGAAIRNTGILTLESCIFSDNRTSAYGACGGALYTTGNTIVSGCTFYGNTTGVYGTSRGGAIYSESGTVNLAGNVFWGNTALEGSVAYGSVTSGGFNVSDKTSGTDTALGSGWTFESTDAQAVSLPVSSVSFRPIGGGIALNRISARPPAYPEVDFYGVDIPETNAAAGAAQTATTGTGYFLDYVPRGPGTVSVTSGTVDFDGFASAVVELTAADKANGTFRYWIVNGTQHTETSNVLALNVDNDTTVQAVFFTVVSSIDDSGPGSLREALTGVIDGGGIVLPASQTITLNTPLLQITKSLVIEGNGATLTQSGFAENSTSQLLIINNNTAEVHISRLHFKGGRTNNYGAGIKTTAGILTLESCIFSDNKASDTQGFGGGGAIYTYGNLTVSGCTFYGNSSTSSGGAIYRQYGTVTLTGNIFWGNTAFQHNVVYSSAGSVISHGYNISDKADGSNATLGSGWTFEAADMQTSMPISPLSFKPIKDGEALNVIPTIPADYPVLDFYGVAIPTEQAASGAIQTATATTGYILDYAPIGPGTINVTGLTLDDDGLISNDSVIILTAQADGNGIFGHWTVDGMKEEAQTPPNALSVIMNDHKTVRAVFYTVVTSSADSGPGSLREALTGVMDGGGIVLPAGQTITLNAPLPAITKSLVIEGNGTTLTQSNFATSATSQLLYINSTTAEVRINRLHFKGGRATNSGAAIFNNGGRLTLESCIFSNNKTSANNAYGGAIYTFGATAFITVSGCAFYGNSAGTAGASQGGAIYCNGGTVNLTGNVFWANTAVQHNVVYGSVISGGFNVSDKADGSDAVLGSGWTFTATDSQAPSLPISPLSFKAIKGSDDLNVITTIPVNYPTVDFYGTAIPAENAAAGAAQTATAGTGYFLDYAFIGPGAVYDGGTMDDDGLRANGSKAILTAQAASDGIFMYWTVDGIKESEQSPQLTVTMDDHKIVQAVFYFAVTNIGNSGPGSLREVLGSMVDGDVILLPAGQTITLNTPLPTITKSIIIEGNGATLIQNGFTESPTSQLLFITSGKLHISRLHFKGGRATNYGAAIRSTGTLTLESCIFSNNRTSASNAQGGAIFISGNAAALIVSGCTFHGNSAGSANTTRGGAIFGSAGTVTLTGNVFWENTAVQGNVMYGNASITSKGHNVSDKASGTTSDASGWNFINSDAQLSGLSFDADFKPSHESLPAIPSPPVGDPGLFPLCYFDGTIRGTAPGAMPSQ